MSEPLAPLDWSRLARLIDELLDTPAAQRPARLDELAGDDPSQRAELERLVAECERSHPLLDGTASKLFASLLDDQPAHFPEGLSDRYRLTRELGRGGMATVFLARDVKHGRDVAVKVMRPELALGRERFLREIAIAARLRHPHIVPLFDSGDVDGVLYYVMPYEDGQSLRTRLAREGTLSVDDAIPILFDLCDALIHAHANGIVHRDIKPDNVLLSGDRNAMVTDFGVARAVSEATDRGWASTGGVAIGTPAYMAPEQVACDPGIDGRADIYSMGILAYELLAGGPPFTADTPQEVLAAQLSEPPPPLSERRPDLPPALVAVVMKCLEKNAARRWQRVDELRHALDRALEVTAEATSAPVAPAAAPVTSPIAEPAMRPEPTAGRRRLVAIGGLAVVIAVAAALGAMRNRNGKVPPAPSKPLTIGILPIEVASAGHDLDWLATGLATELSSRLLDVEQLEIRPNETIAASVALHWPLDSVALVRDVDYFVRATPSKEGTDSVAVRLELIEAGVRAVRAGTVSAPLRAPNVLSLLGRDVAEALRPMLGSHIRQRQVESGTANAAAYQFRRQGDRYRLLARQRIVDRDVEGARRALDSAAILLVESQRLDPQWTAPRLARAALSATRILLLMQPGGPSTTDIRRTFDAGIVIVDSVVKRNPRDAVALALRGQLRWQRTLLIEPRLHEAIRSVDSAQRDLEAALTIDSTLVRPAADLSQLYFEAHARFADAARYAEQAYRRDAFMEDASQIISRLADSNLEIENDEQARYWCSEGLRRFPANPAHLGCLLEVMAWGSGPARADSAWTYFHEFERRVGVWNVSARAIYAVSLAGSLARAGVAADSVRRVLARARQTATGAGAVALNETLLPREAAVLYRLGDSASAAGLVARFRQIDSVGADRLVRRRLLRGYAGRTASRPS